MQATIPHILLQCNCGSQQLTTEYTNLNEAQKHTKLKSCEHENQMTITPVPVTVTSSTSIRCNECRYQTTFNHQDTEENINNEVLTSVLTTQNRNKGIPTHINRTCIPACKMCKQMYKPNQFQQLGTRYSNIPFLCNAQNVVYAIICKKCNQLYVGHTTRKLKERMALHRSSIKHRGNTAVAKHFNLAHHTSNDLQTFLLDRSPNTKTCIIISCRHHQRLTGIADISISCPVT